MKIAIIGAGVSGLTAAYLLSRQHDITVFEANDYAGGHTNTISVADDNRSLPVDTGFIVFNDWTYPNFIKLLGQIGVDSQPSSMGFSVKCSDTGLEYSGASLKTMFVQGRNRYSPSFYRMLLDIIRFNREALNKLDNLNTIETLGEFVERHRLSQKFRDYYLIPMGSAIWSTKPEQMLEFPARTFIQFLKNHGLLNLRNRPTWRVIKGGSQQYVKKLTASFVEKIILNSPIESVRRFEDEVEVKPWGKEIETFDKVVIAAHSDQALKMLADPTTAEQEILGALPYQENTAVLHTDPSLLPVNRVAWSSWNYNLAKGDRHKVTLTYNMNILQNLKTDKTYCVTLNAADQVHPERIIKSVTYHHPVFTTDGIAAQKNKHLISGKNNTYYCGAYWHYGFHEDGVNSALEVCKHFDQEL